MHARFEGGVAYTADELLVERLLEALDTRR
jgi:hypothetical protein